jgi:hypothetical protein
MVSAKMGPREHTLSVIGRQLTNPLSDYLAKTYTFMIES